MVKKKDLVIVALATFCLTSTLFMIISTRSQPENRYNPWMDLDDNGQINILDAIDLSNVYGTSGDPAKSLNVTKTPGMTMQEDLNISTSPWGWGEATTDAFATEGFDRIFVSAAIIDISDYTPGFTFVNLTQVNWRWGTVNGKYMETYAPIDDRRQVDVTVWDTSYIPVSSANSAEFAVQAAQCRLQFHASTWVTSGWVLVRVSIYLTVGTSSAPTVQNTYVTNMPYQQPPPAYTTDSNYVFTPITSGYGSNMTYINVGGYSRMFVSIEIVNASYYGVSAKTTISLTLLYWGDQWYEPVPSGVLNATYYGTSLPAYSQQVPPEFKTKGSYCTLFFYISSEASFGWIEWYAKIYLRNE